MNLTREQLEVVHEMPGTSSEMADALGVSVNAVECRVRRIRESLGDGAIVCDSKGVYHDCRDQVEVSRVVTTSEKRQRSKSLRAEMEELEHEYRKLTRDLPRLEARPVVRKSHEDVVLHCTDDHFGEVITNGEKVIHDTEDTIEKSNLRAQRAMDLVNRQGRVVEYDTLHYLLGGDIVTGDGGTYDGQSWDVEHSLRKQVQIAADTHLSHILSLAEVFEHVQVVCVPGNHGEIRVGESSPETNGDEFVYDRIQVALTWSGVDNVSFVRDPLHAVFEMRGGKHTGLLIHGHKPSVKHAATPSYQNKHYAMAREYGTTNAYIGHFHTYGYYELHGLNLMYSGTLKPTDDYARGLALFNQPAGTLHGVSDKYALTWKYPLYYTD